MCYGRPNPYLNLEKILVQPGMAAHPSNRHCRLGVVANDLSAKNYTTGYTQKHTLRVGKKANHRCGTNVGKLLSAQTENRLHCQP